MKNPISRLIKKTTRAFCMFLVNHIFNGARPQFFGLKRKILRIAGFSIGEGTKIVGPLYVPAAATLIIGNETWVGESWRVHGNGKVVIGSRCDLGPDVTFLTGGHKIGDSNRRAGEGETYHITVGDGCWLGSGSIFMRNISIGNSSVIAARACVTKSTDTNVLMGGVPAKVIRVLEKN